MLTVTTSQIKKRKLSPQYLPSQETGSVNADVPQPSVEQPLSPTNSSPHLELPDDDTTPLSNLPQHLQSFSSSTGADYAPSSASSPSAAYAGLSIAEGDRKGEGSDVGQRQASLAPTEPGIQDQIPKNLFTHRAIMGGADDLPKRASSPLKRPASDLSSEDTPSQKEDVDMVMVPASDSAESARERSPLLRRDRAQSVDMLGDDTAASPAPVTKAPRSFSPTSGKFGTHLLPVSGSPRTQRYPLSMHKSRQ